MQKTLQATVDGVQYNIIQLSAFEGARVQLKILSLLEGLGNIDALFKAQSESDINYSALLQCLSSLPEEPFLELLKILFKTVRRPDRATNPLVSIDEFSADELLTVYQIAWEVIKANFSSFFLKLQGLNTSNIAAVQAA